MLLQHCKVRRILFLLLYFSVISSLILAQESESNVTSSAVILPNGFDAIMLGDTRDLVLEKLQTSTLFEAYNPPEISVIPNTTQQLLHVTGKRGVDNRYIMEAVFQFDTIMGLVTISLFLNRKLLDYYTMYDTHYKKYGRAQSISTTQAIWENETVRIILEKPLNIKYISCDFSDRHISTINTEQRIQNRRKEREAFLSLF